MSITANNAAVASPGPAISLPQVQVEQPDQYQLRELTAQELTADASVWMAGAAALTFLVTLIGTIFIGCQVWLTRRAIQDTSEATRATHEGNAIAQKSLENAQEVAQSDLRAWVTIDLTLHACRRNDEFASIDVNVALKNIGKTPALRTGISLATYVVPSVVTNYGELPALEKWPSRMGALMPGTVKEQRFGKRLETSAIEEGVAEARKAGFEPMIVVDAVVHYHTVFDAEDAPQRLTSVRYHIFNNIPQGHEFRSARMGWLDSYGPAAADQVRFGHDKSAPTYLT